MKPSSLPILAAALLVFSAQAQAHPGALDATLSAAFLHPLSGLDHLLVMTGLGLWAAHLGGRARWLLPLGFLVAMGVGAGMPLDLAPAAVEWLVAATVPVIGLLLASGVTAAPVIGTVIVAGLAYWHGQAHALDWPVPPDAPTLAAFLGATALLHGAGFLVYARGIVGPAGLRRAGALAALGGALVCASIA